MKRLTKCLQGMDIRKTDRVLIQLWGNDQHLSYLKAFEQEACKLSNQVLVHHHDVKAYGESLASETALGQMTYDTFDGNDVVIDLMATSIAPGPDFTEVALNNYRAFMGQMFQKLMTAGTFVQLRLPTEEMADSMGLGHELYKETLLKGLDVDYASIKQEGQELINKLQGVSVITIVTQAGSLELTVEKRQWFNDAGNGDLPCGEVYVACIEDKTNGCIHIEQIKFMDQDFTNLVLTFKDGLLVASNNADFMACFDTLDEDARRVGEFGIGTNTGLSDILNSPLLDEKIKGTAHIALGRNAMFGGNNNAMIHHDLIFRPLEVLIDGQEIKL